jgi:hypothetical protein
VEHIELIQCSQKLIYNYVEQIRFIAFSSKLCKVAHMPIRLIRCSVHFAVDKPVGTKS